MIEKKRGLSNIVATVLLIFLTISAIVITANFIVPFVKNSLEETNCVEFRGYFTFDESFDFNCYDRDNIFGGDLRNYKLSIVASADNSSADNVIGFELRFLREGSAVTASVRDKETGYGKTKDGDLYFGDSSYYENNNKLIIPVSGGKYSVLTYNYLGKDGGGTEKVYTQAKIYPVLKGGKICEESDSIKLTECT